MCNKERLPRDGQKVPSSSNFGNIFIATSVIVCFLHQIPFHEHTFSELSAVQLDRDTVGSDLMAFLKDKKPPRPCFYHPH